MKKIGRKGGGGWREGGERVDVRKRKRGGSESGSEEEEVTEKKDGEGGINLGM